jgi:integrase
MAPGFTVHGFRSTFRDWVGEETEIAGEVAEMALAHQIQNKVEAVYRRGNLFQRRVSLMNQWLAYTESQIP